MMKWLKKVIWGIMCGLFHICFVQGTMHYINDGLYLPDDEALELWGVQEDQTRNVEL